MSSLNLNRKQIQGIIGGQLDPLSVIPNAFFAPHAREIELILLCCCQPQCEPNIRRISDLASSDALDWQFLLTFALEQGLAPLVFHGLKPLPSGVLPEAIKTSLSRETWACAQRNLYFAAELIKILKIFKEEGIDAIPFKGPPLTLELYRDMRLRPSGDLDLLIHRDDFVKAREALFACGFSSKEIADSTELGDLLNDFKDFSFWRADGVYVELHWEVQPRSRPFLPGAEALWPETVKVPFLDSCVTQFTPEILFFLLCVHHGVSHFYDRLILVCDIDRFIKVHSGMNWSRLLRLASQCDSVRAVLLGCLMAETLLGTSLPPEITALLQKDATVQRLARTVLQMRAKTGARKISLPFRLQLYLRVKSHWRGKLLVIDRLLLTPKRVDRQFVTLPARLRVFYLLVRPFRLLFEYLLGKDLD